MKSILATLLMSFTLVGANANNSVGDLELITKISDPVNSNLTYPANAIENREQGTVYIAFTIEGGKIMQAQVVGGVSISLDGAALNMVRNAPVSNVINADLKEDQSYILPIKFALK